MSENVENVIEKLRQTLKTLTEDQKKEVLAFVEKLEAEESGKKSGEAPS